MKTDTEPPRVDTASTGVQDVTKSLMEWDQETVKMRPAADETKVLFYIEDVHLTEFDKV